ncbi:hypothetical protein CDC18_27690 [Pseudomonas aeruginosa]|uniref:hypothetical protein n=1 Tax=Pseudomonas aeruginosa TaxID=287 RepID=UPI000B48DFDC|nr:hypothetical protein [Pseudomonas aeruginosa]OWJ41676.1 hypothetical protein CDC18_27690 [Pseudomonas aeruginosa]
MNRMGQLALFGLLVGTSSNLFAAPGSISGVIRFTGAIVEPPCSMSAPRQDESKGSFHLSGCPMQARTADISIRSMKTGEVRHLQPSDTVIGERDFSAHYELAGSDRRSGNYLITVTYP